MKAAIFSAIISALPLPALSFDLDMKGEDFRSAAGIVVLNDLAVGEAGILPFPELCNRDGQLFTTATQELVTTRLEYAVYWLAIRRPGGKVAFQVKKGERAADAKLGDEIRRALASGISRPCGDAADGQILSVIDINGLTSLKGAINYAEPTR